MNDLDGVYSNFKSNIRTDIKKAKRQNISVIATDSIEDFYKVSKKTFSRQKLNMKYSLESIKRLYEECKKREQGKIFLAVDDKGNVHAGVFLVWDEDSAYYLKGGGDPEFRNSGATSLLMWEVIRFSSTVSDKFDFEGSMIESIEIFFRSFGGVQMQYFSISKAKNRLIDLGLNLIYGSN